MIVSLVKEAEWLTALSSLPIWQPPDNPMLIVAPHPDDETLGAGGLIKAQRERGIDVRLAAVTNGENAYPGVPELGEVRRVEQTDALGQLGVNEQNIVRFGLPDSGVTAREEELTERLRALVSRETHVVAPWQGDFHPDHAACGRAAEKVVAEAGAKLTSYFFWTWHFGTPELIADLSLRRFPLTSELLAVKSEALACHRTQLVHEQGEPILPERLLGPAQRSFEVFATE